MSGAAGTLATLRRMLLALFVLGVVGTVVELLMMEHTEDAKQFIPLALLGAALLVLAAHALRTGRVTVRVFQGMMALFVLGGLLGTVLHYQAKAEFALERRPGITGLELFRQALKGKNPPLLAPGAMVGLGLLGLTWTYRHPALAPVGTDAEPTGASA